MSADGQPRTAKLVIEVLAGLLPGKDPDPTYTRRYVIHSDDWGKAQDAGGDAVGVLLSETNGSAQGYAGWLMLQPDLVNWVRTDWVWL